MQEDIYKIKINVKRL